MVNHRAQTLIYHQEDLEMTSAELLDHEEDYDLLSIDMFEEPEEYRVSSIDQEGTTVAYEPHTSKPGIKSISIHLVGLSALYGHILTHACRYTSKYLEVHSEEIVKDKTVLEVGSGGALPSVLCGYLNALKVVATDYPDRELIVNIRQNLEVNFGKDNVGVDKKTNAVGYVWGNDYAELLGELKAVKKDTFDLIILSDVIFNHSEHEKLLKTCKELVTPLQNKNKPRSGGQILVSFSPHRPKLLDADLYFFERAREQYGFDVQFVEMEMWSPLFKDDTDKSTRELRSRVYFYILHPTW